MSLTIHLIGNAHIDPVWFWDWREGVNEGISTCRAVIDLMQEFQELSFIRGEASVYHYLEQQDPETFEAIRALVRAGRWDVVGGTWIQPDDNLPDAEALLRQYIDGKAYFREKFGVNVTAGWATDAFGHSAGMPEILTAAGITDFACTRPQDPFFPISKPAFWWRGASGARVLTWRPKQGWYATARSGMDTRLDDVLAELRESGLSHGACFYGLGNHGGGPSRRHLKEIRTWVQAHPEVRVVHSGLHNFFAQLREDIAGRGDDFIPTVDGELNFCLRGCSSSVAKFKYAYRKSQSALFAAERTDTAITSALGDSWRSDTCAQAWELLLFNAFHDILPGTSIERAYDDQLAQLGFVQHVARKAETDALMRLARRIDTRPAPAIWQPREDQPGPVSVLLWNPHPQQIRMHAEIEVCLDSRPMLDYMNRTDEVPVAVTDAEGRHLDFQLIRVEHDSLPEYVWRKRAVVPVQLPPLGWTVVHMGLDTTVQDRAGKSPRALFEAPSSAPAAASSASIRNGNLEISAQTAECKVRFSRKGDNSSFESWLPEGLQVRLYEDPWGSWGGMVEEPESWLLADERERWSITDTHVLESGPERSALWVRFEGKNSHLEMTFLLARGACHAEVRCRILFNERSARLKLVMPAGGEALYQVPGGTARRAPCGEVPGGVWVRAGIGNADSSGRAFFASDALYGFDTTESEFRATVCRATRYAADVVRSAEDSPWLPVVDCGELKFKFILGPDDVSKADTIATPEQYLLSALLEMPLVCLTVPARAGAWPATGQCVRDFPPQVSLMALRVAGEGTVELRLQNEGESRVVSCVWFEQRLDLGMVNAAEIATWLLKYDQVGCHWQATRIAL